MIITPEEFNAEVRREYRESELRDIWREQEKEYSRRGLRRRCPNPATRRRSWREAAGGYVMGAGMGAARLNGLLGILDMAIREGLTVRGYWNLSIASSITVASGAVANLNDLSTAANNFAQATAADRPAFTLNDATLRGRATMLGDGTSDLMTCTSYSCPAPGTTPVYWYIVALQATWTSSDNLLNANAVAASCGFQQTAGGASPDVRAIAGAAAPPGTSAWALNTWGRIEAQFQNSAADYFKVLTTNVNNGATFGNNATGTGRRLFCNTGTAFGNFAMAMHLLTEGTANSRFRSFADWNTTLNYGPGLV